MVHRRDIAALLERVTKNSGPVAANRLRATLSALWSWALRTGLINSDSNPVTFTIRQPEKARERVLNDNELKAIWGATNDNAEYSSIVRLCLLTGCRREEIGSLRWDEVQADKIVFGPRRMKGNVAHEIALLPMILAALPKRPEMARSICVRQVWYGLFRLEQEQEKAGRHAHEIGPAYAPLGAARSATDVVHEAARCWRGAARDRGASRPQTARRSRGVQPRFFSRREARGANALAQIAEWDNRVMRKKDLGELVAEELPCDPDVKLPADVQATIARGEEAFQKQSRSEGARVSDASGLIPSIITSVVDQRVQDRRDTNLDAQELPTKRNRRQPPMIRRLRAVMIELIASYPTEYLSGLAQTAKCTKRFATG